MIFDRRLIMPDNIMAILWDMDGVLIDSLGLDLVICNELVKRYIDPDAEIPREMIRSLFAYDPMGFWEQIFEYLKKEYHLCDIDKFFDEILNSYYRARGEAVFALNPGIKEILNEASKRDIKMAVVSNNPTGDVKEILAHAGILKYFNLVAGNDLCALEKKPAPDTYLYAASQLYLDPADCMVVEDSVLGAEAGKRAGCFTVGIATGGDRFEMLDQSRWTDRVYTSFEQVRIEMGFGDVRDKSILTANEFISHMIEHIAWRIGLKMDIFWNNNDWHLLGEEIGHSISEFPLQTSQAAALSMIDDGSAEVIIDNSGKRGFHMESIENTNLNWFLSLRCERLLSGEPLVRLMKGLTKGLNVKCLIRVCSVEDPHHTWEGIFRSIGIALRKIYRPTGDKISPFPHSIKPGIVKSGIEQGNILIEECSIDRARVIRETAESRVNMLVDFAAEKPPLYRFNVSSSINITGFGDLLAVLAKEAGFSIEIDFEATLLSSSHVVLEDTGLVLGRALREIFILRMQSYGVNGAGDSLHSIKDFDTQPIRVGISIEGRKFWRMLPFSHSYDQLKKGFIIGHNVFGNLFSEDLDDFLDGLSGGLGCSIMIHILELPAPDEGWRLIFQMLGKALKEALSPNYSMKGLPPGVKATLS